MKKGLRIALALVLAVVFMFTSCDNQTQTPPATDTVGYARFAGGDVQSRDLSAGYELQAYADLYWFYDAKKADSFGTIGAGSKLKVPGDAEDGKGLDGQITLSQGLWNFTLYAYASIDEAGKPVEGTLAYKGETSGVTIRGGEVTTVPVTVTPQGDTGTVKFGEASFSWKDGGTGKPVIRFTFTNSDNESYVAYVTPDDSFKLSGTLLFREDSSSAIPVGFYTCKAEAFTVSDASEITEGMTPVTDMTFSLQVIGGATTVINGVITESEFGSVSFDVITAESDVVVFHPTADNNSVTFNTAPTEDDSMKTTVVDFGGNDLSATQNVIDITVLSQVAADKGFQIVETVTETEGKAVASISLSLSSIGEGTQTPVTEFENEVKITTYIAKGLGTVENLKLIYVSDGKEVESSETFKHEIINYNSDTGELVFTTNHFSQFYVVSDKAQEYVAVNVTTDVGYSSFADAFDGAEDGDIIRLVDDVIYSGTAVVDGKSVGAGVKISGKHITLDLAGHKITVPETYSSSSGILIVKDDGGLTVEDSSEAKSGTIDVSTGNPIVYSCIVIYPDEAGGETESLIINGGTFKSDAFPISGNAHLQNSSDTYIEINDGNFISEMGPAIFHPQVGVLKISGGYFEGCTGIEIRAGNVEITGGEFVANGAFKTYPDSASDGNTVDGATVAVSQHVYKPEISLTISGGTFSGKQALYEKNIVKNDPSVPITLSVTGGDFSGSIYSQNCTGFASGGKYSYISDRYIATGYLSREDEDGNDEVLPFRVIFDETFESGKGTESDPYLISTLSQFKMISEQTADEVFYELSNNITNSGTVVIDENAKVHLNKAGYNITFKPVMNRFNVQGELEITGDGTVESGSQYGVFQVHNGGKLVVDGGSYINTGTWYTILAEGDEEPAVIEFKDGVVESTEPCIQIQGKADVTISGGTFTSTDNAVIFVFGGDEFTHYPYELTVNGGSFFGSSESEGCIACGINMGNSGEVTLNGGTFNITDGIGILARCGTLIANEGATFNCTGDQRGQIGDSSVQIKAGSAIVVDEYANYPGGKPSVTNNGGYQLKDVYGADFPNTNG